MRSPPAPLPSASSPVSPTATEPRSFGLDVLRAVSMLAVIYGHSLVLRDPLAPPLPLGFFDPVTAFFVMSGFLIGRLLIRAFEAAPTVRTLAAFLAMRWLRTLPAYFAALGMISLTYCTLSAPELPADWSRFLWFGQNLAWAHPGFFGEAWSLSVEEWFYLSTPALILVLMRLTGGSVRALVPLIALTIIAASCLMRAALLSRGLLADLLAWDALMRKVVVFRLDSIMWGLLAAWVWIYHGAQARRWAPVCSVLGLCALMLIALSPWQDLYSATWIGLFLTPIAVAFALPWMTTIRQGPRWLARPAIVLSRMSYSLYLVHGFLVMGLLMPWMTTQYPVKLQSLGMRIAVYWTLTFALGWLLWRFVEHPAMRLGQALMPRRTPPVTPGSTVEARTVPA